MVDQRTSLVDAVRNEEYTGENRCIPCTAVNVGIALLLGAVVALVAVELAVVVVVVSLASIYLRGYLVPGTPTLTKRYLPNRVLQLFDHHPLEEEVVENPDEETGEESFETVEKIRRQREEVVDPEQFLLEVDVVTPTEDGSDLRLTEEFAAAADREIEEFRGTRPDRAAVADVFDVDSDDVEFKQREYPAVRIGRRIRKWPSDGALLVDVATHRALAERTDRWRQVPLEQRVGILESLRTFRDSCPICDGEVDFGEAVVESCCATYEVISFECLDCGERFLELDPAKIDEGDGTGIQP